MFLFLFRDADLTVFRITHTTLINLVAPQLQSTFEQRKFEIEHNSVQFELEDKFHRRPNTFVPHHPIMTLQISLIVIIS